MGRLHRPTLPPGPLNDLVRELHALHARAGRPSTRELARSESFSHTAVHDLFTRTVLEAPRLPVLHRVVERLAALAPRTDVEDVLDRFDELWRAADECPFDDLEGEEAAPGGDPIRAGQLLLVYQPVVREDGTIVRAEAFARWRHPTTRVDLPQEIDLRVLREAVEEAATWSGAPAGIAVNTSDLLLTRPGAVEAVIAIVERAGIREDRVTIEVTEACLRGAVPALEALAARGLRVALDDFGTGYSSLARLRDAPVHSLKIAAEFVAPVAHDRTAAAVVRAVCDMAHAMGRTTSAEDVETEEQFAELRRIGVDEFQGRLFSMPVPPEEMRDMIARGSLPPRERRW